jgi:glycosidase
VTRRRVGAAALLLALAGGASAAGGLKLHVPSPDWRDQIIYFVVTDRFADGDPRNNDQGAGEYRPGERSKFQGGDLAGLRQRLAYVQGLGATALWITPPVANQWLDRSVGYSGYHGYWAEHFMRVDRHLGTLRDYQLLSDSLHRRGMYLIQDIVVNHVGNFFDFRADWRADAPERSWIANAGSAPMARPSQKPFDQIDARDPKQRAAGIYHWTPKVADYTDANQEANFQMSGLDDLNTGNPVVRRALRESYGYWIREVGVDAFRVDTAFYVPAPFFDDFLHARDAAAPGVAEVARRSGRREFLVFGEGFGIDRPFDDTQARKIERYATAEGGASRMPGMLNFPLYGALNDAFARGKPTAELAHRIDALARVHRDPHRMVNFVDNHDVDRFLAGGREAGLRQALLAMFTLPGIPVVYYGTEQGFTEQRAAMFAAGWGSGGRDRFDPEAPLYRLLARLAELRKSDPAFSRGTAQVLHSNAAGSGVIAWRLAYEGRQAVVALNTADTPMLLDRIEGDWPAGMRLTPRFALDGSAPAATVGPHGALGLVLPPRSGWVWIAAAPSTGPAAAATTDAPTLEALPTGAQGGDFRVGGRAAGAGPFRLVVDGDLAAAREVLPEPEGRWSATVDTASMGDPAIAHRVTLWDEGRRVAAAAQSFRVERSWTLLADVADPAGDDRGPTGAYVYPTDSSWGDNRQMDLRRVRVFGSGGSLRIEVTLNRITTSWSPANGFDHVAVTAFVEVPGRPGGATTMPLQQASLPEGMRWHLRLRANGWSNALFTDVGASASDEGTPAATSARIAVDRAANTVTFTLPASALASGLGRAANLSGAKVLVTTWDYDGGYRKLSEAPAAFAVGGGVEGRDAKVMDASAVIVLP